MVFMWQWKTLTRANSTCMVTFVVTTQVQTTADTWFECSGADAMGYGGGARAPLLQLAGYGGNRE